MDDIPKKDASFIVSVDRGTHRGFVSFESTEDFLPWYRLLRPDERTLNEVITSDTRKLILDIDSPDQEKLPMFFMYDWQRHVTNRITEVFGMLDIGNPDVVCYDICSEDKISYHFVVSNFAFSAQTCLGLCVIISQGQIWRDIIDTSVYKSIQCMRLEGSTKFGERRWKTCVTNRRFSCGLVSDLRDTTLSEISCKVSPFGIRALKTEVFMLKPLRGIAGSRQRRGFWSISK